MKKSVSNRVQPNIKPDVNISRVKNKKQTERETQKAEKLKKAKIVKTKKEAEDQKIAEKKKLENALKQKKEEEVKARKLRAQQAIERRKQEEEKRRKELAARKKEEQERKAAMALKRKEELKKKNELIRKKQEEKIKQVEERRKLQNEKRMLDIKNRKQLEIQRAKNIDKMRKEQPKKKKEVTNKNTKINNLRPKNAINKEPNSKILLRGRVQKKKIENPADRLKRFEARKNHLQNIIDKKLNEKRLVEEFSGDLIKKITKVEEDILVKTDELFCKKEQFIDLYCIYNGLEKLVYKLLQKIKDLNDLKKAVIQKQENVESKKEALKRFKIILKENIELNLEENKEDKKNANKQLSSTLNNIKELIQDEENCKHMCELIDEEISGKQSLLESIKLILSKFTN